MCLSLDFFEEYISFFEKCNVAVTEQNVIEGAFVMHKESNPQKTMTLEECTMKSI